MADNEAKSRGQRPAPATTDADGHVRVAVRVRPLLPAEIAGKCTECVSHPGPRMVAVGSTHQFTYDYAFPASSSQVWADMVAVKPFLS